MILVFEDNNDMIYEEIYISKQDLIQYISDMAYEELIKRKCIDYNNEQYNDTYLIDIRED